MGPNEAQSACAFGRTVPALAENVASLRHSVVDLAVRAGAGDDVRTDVALAIGEACANVVVHAYPPGDVGPLVVHATVEHGELHIHVCDQGSGMVPRPDSPGLGLGLPLMANVTDRLEIRDGPGKAGTELVMVFALQREPPRPA